MEKSTQFQTMDSFQEKAYGLILGDAKKAFDLSQEKDELRDKYGRNHFGQSCLLARRLGHAPRQLWQPEAAVVHPRQRLFDSDRRPASERTAGEHHLSSVWYGEFGRTPKISWEPPWFGGRHHWGSVFSCVVAGGGFKGGSVVGSSDPRGERVKDRPVYPWDLNASIYKLLGIDPNDKLPHPQGCVAYVSPLATGAVQTGGLLTEIM